MDSSFFLTIVAAAVGLFILLKKFRFLSCNREKVSSSSTLSSSLTPSVPSSSLSTLSSPASSLTLASPSSSLRTLSSPSTSTLWKTAPSLSSSSSPPPTWKYDVFPSFSGKDVRKSFLSHLLVALRRKSVVTFIDDGIERSRQIAAELLYAIRQSRISIVVFSNKYATSTWCLNELAEIHECFKKPGYIVIPIFYNVDTSDVRNQRGDFGKAFEDTCKGEKEEDKLRWRNALSELAGVAGYDSRNG